MEKLKFNPDTHEYFYGDKKVPGVNEIFADLGMVDYSRVPQDKLEIAREFGKAMHKTCELYDKNELNESTLDDKLKPYLEAWKLFKQDYLAEFEERNIERIVHHQIDGLEYAGTADRFCNLYENTHSIGYHVIEIKTSYAISRITALQTMFYAEAEAQNVQIRPGRICVLLKPNKYKIKKYNDDIEDRIALSAVRLWHWKYDKKYRGIK